MLTNSKQILLVIPNLGMGGAQRSFMKLADWLSESYVITIVVFDDSYENVYPVKAAIHYLGSSSSKNKRDKILNFFKRINRLRQLKKELKPHACISFLEGADYINILSNAGEKKVISIRGSKKYDSHIKGISGFIRLNVLIPLLYRMADKIVTASLGLQKEISEAYPKLNKKLVTIPNGYRLGTGINSKPDHPYFILGWAGRFGDEKGLLEFIKVFKECHDIDNSFRLLLIGKGTLQSAIQAYFSDVGKNCIISTGIPGKAFIRNEIVICHAGDNYEQTLSLTNLFLLTSPSEGFPNVLIEAMNLGIPAVSTDCKWGPREILVPEVDYCTHLEYPHYGSYGILLPILSGKETEKEQWVETILDLKRNPKILCNYINKGSDRIRHFDQKIIKQQWVHLIKELE